LATDQRVPFQSRMSAPLPQAVSPSSAQMLFSDEALAA
jgi:hypothetical protein